MIAHEHNFEGAVWHYVATDAHEQEYWVRLCTVEGCSEDEGIIITKEQREQDFIDAWEARP